MPKGIFERTKKHKEILRNLPQNWKKGNDIWNNPKSIKTQFKKGNQIWLGKHHLELSKEKMRIASLGKHLSKETREKISQSHKGKKPYKMTDEIRKNMSKARKGEKRKPRTEVTKEKIRLTQVGEKGHNWKGGKMPMRFRYNWKSQKIKALKRDNYSCRICGKSKKENGNRELDVHHKIPFRFFKDKNNAHDLNNLITLCRQCHLQEETKKTIVNASFGKNCIVWNYVNILNSEFGDNVKVGSFVEINGSKIGNNCKIQAGAFIPFGFTLEDNVFWGPQAIGTNDKYPPSNGKKWQKTIVKKSAVIGANATILPGVIIGECAMVGAGSVVVKSVGAGEVVAGNPAKPLKGHMAENKIIQCVKHITIA